MALLLISDFGKRADGDTSFGACGASWTWDGTTLTVTNPAHGFFPFYIIRKPGSFGISTDIASLLPHVRTDLDRPAIALFLRLPYYYDDDTPFAHVKAFPAAGLLTWTAGEETLGDLFEQPDRTGLDRRAIKQRYNDLFVQAVARCRPTSPTLLPLSGGRDSRHILLELLRQGRPPAETVTARPYLPTGDGDIRVAARLAERAGVPWRQLPHPPPFFGAFIEGLHRTSFQTLMHAWLLPLVESVSGKAIYDGIAGDVLTANPIIREDVVAMYETGRLEELTDRMLANRPEADLPEPWRAEYPVSLARERLVRELARFAHLHNPLTQFFFWNRTRRGICPYTFSMLGAHNDVHTPFLDRDLCRFLLSIPTAKVIGQTLHSEVIQDQYPDFADIPYKGPKRSRGGRFAFLKFALQADRHTRRGVTSRAEAVRAIRRREYDRPRQLAIYLHELRRLSEHAR